MIVLVIGSAALVAGSSTADKNEKKPKVDPRIKEGWLYHTADDTHHIRLKIDKAKKKVKKAKRAVKRACST